MVCRRVCVCHACTRTLTKFVMRTAGRPHTSHDGECERRASPHLHAHGRCLGHAYQPALDTRTHLSHTVFPTTFLPAAEMLVRWWSLLPTGQLKSMVNICQQFITVRLYHTQRVDDAVIAGTRVYAGRIQTLRVVESDPVV